MEVKGDFFFGMKTGLRYRKLYEDGFIASYAYGKKMHDGDDTISIVGDTYRIDFEFRFLLQ